MENVSSGVSEQEDFIHVDIKVKTIMKLVPET